MTRHRLKHALAGLCASGLATASLAMVGVAVAPAADAAAPPGTPWTFGENSFGQLGNGTTTTRRSGAPVTGLNGVIDLHGGREHVVALKSDGTVWTWGSNVEGQQGRGTTANTLTPTQVTSLGTNNVAVETGHNHTVVLKSNGTVWAFGLNSDGQLGDGTTTTRRSPVQVSGINDAIGIAAGRDMSYAIRPGGQVWAWGRNVEGQMGDGTTTRRPAPVRVGTSINFADVKMLTGGRDHAVAVKNDGSVWAWGWNAYGQIGDGTTTSRLTPVPIDINGATAGNGTSIEAAAGAHHSYALRTDGTVASWGRNYRTELGDGTSTSRTRPVNVLMGTGSTPLSGAVSIGSGRDMGNVTLADGRVMAWGHNVSGQLGDGTVTNRTRAIVVPGITNAVKAGGGGSAYGVVLVGDTTTPPVNQPPVARITGTNCTDLTCPLSGSTSSDDNGIVSYAWNFGDTETGTGVSPGHTYDEGDTYTVTLTVTDAQGLTDTETASVSPTDPGPPVNQPPVAHITGTTCSGHVCPLNGSTSSDDHGISTYAWEFGDTETGTGADGTHTYGVAATYTVTLTVTDAEGLSDSDTATVTPSDAPPVTSPVFRGSISSDANTSSASVVVPAAVQPGDQLVLVATTNTAATHTTPAGWTLLGSTVDGTEMRSSVYTRTTPVGGLAGTTVRVAVSGLSKTSLSLDAYSNAAPVTVLANAVQGTTTVTAHPAPAVNVAVNGSAVLRYWCDKSSSARTWATPAGLTRRTTTTGSGGGSLASFTADVTDVPAGAVAALNATASLGSNKAIAWTVVVPHA